jgi:protein-L-isoaspartate(D-aspartate) O-methyltransferase
MAGRWFPGRAACLENSLAAVLAAAARGQVVDWCIGARFAPFASHAWQAALESVDEDSYTQQPDGTRIPQSSSRLVIAGMLDLLAVETGMRVLEIGTGSGYSTGLISHLVGDDGRLTSVEIDRILTARADQLLHHDGRRNVDLITGDGVKGTPGFHGHFHRVIAWATVEQIPGAWAAQAAPGAILVAPVNLTSLPKTHAVVRARYDATIPGFVGKNSFPAGSSKPTTWSSTNGSCLLSVWTCSLATLTTSRGGSPPSGCEPEVASRRDGTYSTISSPAPRPSPARSPQRKTAQISTPTCSPNAPTASPPLPSAITPGDRLQQPHRRGSHPD